MNAVNSNQYDEIYDDDISDDEIFEFVNTEKFPPANDACLLEELCHITEPEMTKRFVNGISLHGVVVRAFGLY